MKRSAIFRLNGLKVGGCRRFRSWAAMGARKLECICSGYKIPTRRQRELNCSAKAARCCYRLPVFLQFIAHDEGNQRQIASLSFLSMNILCFYINWFRRGWHQHTCGLWETIIGKSLPRMGAHPATVPSCLCIACDHVFSSFMVKVSLHPWLVVNWVVYSR